MPPSRDQLPKRLRDSLERMAAQSGASREYVTPDYDRVLSSYQPESATGGGGGFGLRDLGSGILNALSVPQAALGTALFKGSQLIPGSRAKDKDIPWRAALGDFYRDEKGRTGWQELTQEGMGLDSRQGFALGLAADPLWAVGLVTKPIQAAAKVGKAAKGAKAADEVPELIRSRKAVVPVAGKPHIRTKPATVSRSTGPELSPLGALPRTTQAAVQDVLKSVNKTGNISKGAHGNLLRNILSRTGETKEFAKTRGTGGKEVFLRLGFGEKLSKDIKLGTTKARAFNNTKTGLMGLGRSPLERGAHQVKVSNQELTQIAVKFLEGVKRNWEQTLNLSDEAAEKAAQRVGLVAIAANQSPGTANVLRGMFKADGLWDDNYDTLLAQLREHWDEFAEELGMSTTKRPGPYVPTKLANETTEEFTERWRQAVARGEVPEGTGGGFGGGPNPTEARTFESPLAAMTADEAVEQLTRVGLSKADAEEWVSTWQQFAPEASRFADESTGFAHELDIFKLAEWREKGQMRVILDRQIKEIATDAGIFNEKVIKELASTSLAGPLARTELGKKLMKFVGIFKTVLTTINPSHFVRNATGDYWNHLINGHLRHLKSTAVTSKSPFWRIARGDEDALAKTFKVGDQEFTGAELFVEASFMGLGRGYVGSDIAQMMDLYQGGIHNWGIFKHGTRINMHRENAVRLETYIKHRQAGEDMMSAAAKTLRVHFDYSDLTDVEKVFARNLLLFYTWLRRNTMLQMSGLLTRPGMFSAAGTMEAYRPKLEGEPEYLSKLGMVGAPGLGYFNIGNPMEAIHNFDPTNENFRQTILGAVNPLVRVPAEIGINQNVRTGYDISRGPGDKQPGLTPWLLDKVPGVNLPQASFTGQTDPGPAMNPTIRHIIENLILVGPQASTAGAAIRPDEEYRPDAGVTGLIERLFGVRRHREDPVQAARGVLAKVRDARREVDIRRKYRIGA